MALSIRYNSPVVLTFSLLSIAVFFIDYLIFGGMTSKTNPGSLINNYFVLAGYFNWGSLVWYFSLFSYTLGHASVAHIVGNMSLLLLLGPIAEEKYGSRKIFQMMIVCTLVTALFQIVLFDTGLLGASGLVFMFIVLVSFADARAGTIPITFILVALFYLGQEVLQSFDQSDQISQYAHIAGGVLGTIFGFTFRPQSEDLAASKSGLNGDILD